MLKLLDNNPRHTLLCECTNTEQTETYYADNDVGKVVIGKLRAECLGKSREVVLYTVVRDYSRVVDSSEQLYSEKQNISGHRWEM